MPSPNELDCTPRSQPDGSETDESRSNWIEHLRAKPPEWLSTDPEKLTPMSTSPSRFEVALAEGTAGQEPDRQFAALCSRIGIERYARELAEIEAGTLPDLPSFRKFRQSWADREHPWDGAVLMGSTGAGKSVMACWACRWACRQGGTFDWIDMMEMPSILYADDSAARLRNLSTAGLLVIDEIGDSSDLRGRSWAEIKSRINLRYRADLPTILGSIPGEEELRGILGAEVLRRFPLRVGGAR